jgi:hypothetical protein
MYGVMILRQALKAQISRDPNDDHEIFTHGGNQQPGTVINQMLEKQRTA